MIQLIHFYLLLIIQLQNQLVDISSIKSENYFDTKEKVDLEIKSQSGIDKKYVINLERIETKTTENKIEKISIHSNKNS